MPVQSGLIPGAGYQDFIDVDYIWIHLIHCLHHQGPLSLFHGNLNKTTKGIKALATRLLLTLQPTSKSEFEAQLTANMKRYASIVHHMTLAVMSYHAIAQNPRLIEAQLSTTRPKDMNRYKNNPAPVMDFDMVSVASPWSSPVSPSAGAGASGLAEAWKTISRQSDTIEIWGWFQDCKYQVSRKYTITNALNWYKHVYIAILVV